MFSIVVEVSWVGWLVGVRSSFSVLTLWLGWQFWPPPPLPHTHTATTIAIPLSFRDSCWFNSSWSSPSVQLASRVHSIFCSIMDRTTDLSWCNFSEHAHRNFLLVTTCMAATRTQKNFWMLPTYLLPSRDTLISYIQQSNNNIIVCIT